MAADPLQQYLDDAAELAAGLQGNALSAYNDLEFFSEWVMGYQSQEYVKPSPFISKIYNELQHSDERSFLILGPRGSAKSQTVTVNYTLWKIGRNPIIRYLIVFAAKETQGYPFSNQIAGVIEQNDRYREVFGDLKPKRRNVPWSVESRTVNRPEPPSGLKDATITIAGYGSNLPSKRADEVIIDDIVTAENAYSETQQDQIEHFVFQTVFPILVPGGRRIIVGSRWDMRDLYARVADRWNLTIPEPDLSIDLDGLIELRTE